MVKQLDSLFSDKYTLVEAITCDSDETKEYKLPENHRFTAMSQVAICYSHLKCIKEIYDNKLTFGAIIEDDIHIKENFGESLNKMIENSPNVLDIFKKEPCILHLVSNPSHNTNRYKFDIFPKVINICFYVINHQFAKILLENEY
jgi:GR25 family glycosyltransferase involved in LPS biosynthesis